MRGETDTWSLRQLHPRFGAELRGHRIGSSLAPPLRQGIIDAVHRFGVVALPDQHLSDDELRDFAGSIGKVHGANSVLAYGGGGLGHLTNLDGDGNILPATDRLLRLNDANELWHTDSTYLRPRATFSMLQARVVPPEGGNTEFCDTRCAYDDLEPERRAELTGYTASHSLIHSRALTGFSTWTPEERGGLPAVERPLVHLHSESGRMALCLAAHIEAIRPLSPEDARSLLDTLIERATAPDAVYSHEWQIGDLLLWDNRCMMHRARPYDQARHGRDMQTIRLDDETDG